MEILIIGGVFIMVRGAIELCDQWIFAPTDEDVTL